ncbi:uncharacterized protein [Dysidea avara]|uniref:uncharacterized protein n=1 Tax=Dysidea avara TaxID=196820 RepID=UPI00331CE163
MAQASVANMQIEEAYDAACLDLQGDYNETIETDNESSENHILQQLMVEIEADLSKVSRMNNRKTGNWTERMERSEESWEAIRPTLFEYSVASAAPPKHKDCFHCGERSGVVRCWQCGPSCMLCAQCDIKIHTMVALHNRDIWTGSCFLSVSPTQYVDENTHDIVEIECPIPLTVPKVCPSCGVKGDMDVYKSGEAKRIIVTMSGRYDLSDAHVVCLACHTVFADVFHETVSEGFWPGSAGRRSAYLFHQDVFKFFIHLKFFNPGMSQSGFLKTLEQISLLNGRIPTINPTAFSKALSEWKYCQYEKQKLKGVPLLDCPACYSNQHSVHIDGNKKLYRFSKVPRGSRKSYYDGAFIAKNEDVDDHLALIGYFDETLMRDDQCGSTRWKAAKAVSRTMPSLDETGLEVGGCRHAIAQKAVNMFRGEIYGYAHYLHTKVFAPRNVSYFWEDIVCKYWPWARNKEHLFPGSMDMIPCLSVMHGKAHSWPCGIIWGGRWQDGAAGGSGEDMEQLFSNLSRWAFSTKNVKCSWQR